MSSRIIAFIIGSIVLSGVFCPLIAQENAQLPSAVKTAINAELREYRQKVELKTSEEFFAARAGIARKHLPSARREGLETAEQLVLAELFAWSGENAQALAIYHTIAAGSDLTARNAAKSALSLLIADETVPLADIEKQLADFRLRFKPVNEDSFGLYEPIARLSNRLKGAGELEAALRICMDEIAYLDVNVPGFAWFTVERAGNLMIDLGRKDEAIAFMNAHAEKFKTIVADRTANRPADAGEDYDKLTKSFETSSLGINSAIVRATIIGSPAPGFEFTHFFNTEPIDFAQLRGKVIVLDFWANWCGPCIASFPQMREMQAKYAGRDVQIIGVTGFQGSMANHGGDRVQDISQEEELKLTAEFIKFQNVTWPVAFSTRNCYDPAYGVMGIPEVVIIDRKGIVRLYSHPSEHGKIEALIDELLSQ